MRGSKFIGMTVLDKNAKKVGKISELALELKKYEIDNIFIFTGSTVGKRYFIVLKGTYRRWRITYS